MKELNVGIASFLAILTVCPGSPVQPTNFLIIGQINGKFFAYDNTMKNWTDAGVHCESGGLQLAEISTLGELQFLKSHYSSGFAGTYWTAGADAMDVQQFIWTGTGNQISHNLQHLPLNAPQTCLTFVSSRGEIQSQLCDVSSTYVLCQTVQNLEHRI